MPFLRKSHLLSLIYQKKKKLKDDYECENEIVHKIETQNGVAHVLLHFVFQLNDALTLSKGNCSCFAILCLFFILLTLQILFWILFEHHFAE